MPNMPKSDASSPPLADRSSSALLTPHWDSPMARIGACMTTRRMPALAAISPSAPPHDAFNLGAHVGDVAQVVAAHRSSLAQSLGVRAVWMDQVHGDRVVRLTAADALRVPVIEADGAWTDEPGVACVVMVADCLPILLAVDDGRAVAALHAGWRGLAGRHADGSVGPGIVQRGVAALCAGSGCEPAQIQAWIGPCIGPSAFQVGVDVLEGFGVTASDPGPHFLPCPESSGSRWWGHLAAMARERLQREGVTRISGGHWCTVSDSGRFFSFRRDGVTGRQAALIWRR